MIMMLVLICGIGYRDVFQVFDDRADRVVVIRLRLRLLMHFIQVQLMGL